MASMKIAALFGAALSFGAVAAQASPVTTLSYQLDGGAMTFLADDTATPGDVSFSGAIGGLFRITSFTAQGGPAPNLNGADFGADLQASYNVKSGVIGGTFSGTHTLALYATETGIAAIYNPIDTTESFQVNGAAAGTTTLESMLLSTANLPNVGTQIASVSYGSGTHSSGILPQYSQPISGTFALTEKFVLTANATNLLNQGNIAFTAVPEPMTVGILGLALAGLGAVRRKRG